MKMGVVLRKIDISVSQRASVLHPAVTTYRIYLTSFTAYTIKALYIGLHIHVHLHIHVACTCMLPAHAFYQHVYVACNCVFALLVHLPSCADKGLLKINKLLGD